MSLAKKDADNGMVEFQFYKPDNRTKWEAFQTAIYDKSTNQFFGRTPKNWGQLLLFYSIFYIVLAAMFAICMQALFATLNDREPKWKLNDSLIGDNPGMGFRPISERNEEGSLIWYNITNATTTSRWVKLIDTFLKPYRANQTGKNYTPCYFGKPPGEGKVCITTTDNFGTCGTNPTYGYNTSSPCVFLKLNRIIDWNPQYFTSSQPDMPSDLTNYITSLKNSSSQERRVWVSCRGASDLDKENIKSFNYFPKGFASYYYPFKNVKNYLSPIVAVQIVDIQPNVIVQVECRAWAENVKYKGGAKRAGSVTFEIQVDREYQPPAKSANLKPEKNKDSLSLLPNETESVTNSAIVVNAKNEVVNSTVVNAKNEVVNSAVVNTSVVTKATA